MGAVRGRVPRGSAHGPILFAEAYPIVEHLWVGLAELHGAGGTHDEIALRGVFLERRPEGATRARLHAFPVARWPEGPLALNPDPDEIVSRRMALLPPERIQSSKAASPRSDVYACTTVIYTALSNELPHPARNILELVERKAAEDPRPLAVALGRPVAPALERFLARGLARRPEDCFPSAIEALDAWHALRGVAAGDA